MSRSKPWAARHPGAVILLWLVVVLAALPLAATVTRHLQAENLDVSGSGAAWADGQLARLRPPDTAGPTLIQGLTQGTVGRAAAAVGVPAGWLHPMAGAVLLLPPPGTPAALIRPLLAAAQHRGAAVQSVGPGAMGTAISSDATRTLRQSSSLALPILVLLLPLVFGTIAQAVSPLVVAAVGAELALALVSILERYVTLSVYLTDIVSFLALGVGVDYALFITMRFREALERGQDVEGAVREAMRTAGRSVFFSGLAVTLAVATLLLGGTSYWRGLALGGATAVVAVLISTHTLLPALLRALGRHASWGRVPVAMERWPLWRRLAAWSTWRPGISVLVGVGLLGAGAYLAPGLQSTVPADLASMLPPSAPLRQASMLQQRLQGPGSIDPLPIALHLTTPISDARTWTLVQRLAARLRQLPGVAAVASPTGDGVAPGLLAATMAQARSAAALGPLASFVNPEAPHLVALFVTAASGPDQPATRQLVRRINTLLRQELPPGGRGAVGGAVAVLRTFTRHTDHRLPWILGAAAAIALVVLWMATGSVVQAAAGVLLDALVAAATAGLLVLTVQHGALGLAPESPNLTVTPLIFVLLFGLSMDYEVILLHRIQELLAAGTDGRQAAREGIAQTGGMITGAGLVIVTAFIVLLRSPLEVLKTLAIGMTAAILLDTWIVRSFLIPGITVLLGSWAFWPWRAPRGRPPSQEP